jgi:hypothetical protein
VANDPQREREAADAGCRAAPKPRKDETMRLAKRLLLSVACIGMLVTPALAAAKQPKLPTPERALKAWEQYSKRLARLASPTTVHGTPLLHGEQTGPLHARASLAARKLATIAEGLASLHPDKQVPGVGVFYPPTLADQWRVVHGTAVRLAGYHDDTVRYHNGPDENSVDLGKATTSAYNLAPVVHAALKSAVEATPKPSGVAGPSLGRYRW